MPLDEIKARARKFGRTIRRRNLIEYAAAVFVVLAFGRLAVIATTPTIRIGAAMIVAATLFIVYYMHTRSWVPASSDDAAASQDCTAFYRALLTRQRDVLRGVWWWYLLPFVPGLLLMVIGRVAQEPDRVGRAVLGIGLNVAVFLGIGLLNERAARKLQREIDALDANNA